MFLSPENDPSSQKYPQEAGGAVNDPFSPQMQKVENPQVNVSRDSNVSKGNRKRSIASPGLEEDDIKMMDSKEHEREELNSTIVPGKSRFPIKYSKKPNEPKVNTETASFMQNQGTLALSNPL